MDCNITANKSTCNCTYAPCPRKGRCCACIAYHLENRELPALGLVPLSHHEVNSGLGQKARPEG